jgi:hypothetical protein
MRYELAVKETKKLFGEDSFTESDETADGRERCYIGRCPTTPGKYEGYMAFSWEEVLELARASLNPPK